MEIEMSRRLDKLQAQHNAVQAELAASRDVLSARDREVDVLRMRVEEAEREAETLREDLARAQQRITTLLEMNQPGFHLESEDEGDELRRTRDSAGSSEEASMAFDKVSSGVSHRFKLIGILVDERAETMGKIAISSGDEWSWRAWI